jgi:uncharacterized BrkB/YihY/UPF0761 family membrane protein
MMVVAVLGLAAVSIVQEWFGFAPDGAIAHVASLVGVLAGEFLFFLVLYRLLTPEGPGIFAHLPGTVAFVVSFSGLTALGGFYFSHVVAESTALYGTIGSLFGVIALVYSTAWLLLASAELSAFVWHRDRERRPGDPIDDPSLPGNG